MKIPAITGLIRRRLLVNYRIAPEAARRVIPEPFRPKLVNGFAIGGICLIRLEGERPTGVPKMLGMASENAAHRFAVEWTDPGGGVREGVYVPRRDTDSFINRVAGGRVFASEYHAAKFRVLDQDGRIDFRMESTDGEVAVTIIAEETDDFPTESVFRGLEEASRFFEAGSLGYSPDSHGSRLAGVELVTNEWQVRPLRVEEERTSFFDDRSRFPEGSVAFDHALIMRDIHHEWRQRETLAGGS